MNDDIDLNDLFHEDEPEKESAPTKICHEKDWTSYEGGRG